MIAASAPGSRADASKANPGDGSASLASPTGVSGESPKAMATPPMTPPAAMISVVVMLRTTSWRRVTPRALKMSYGSASMVAWRESAWATTTIPASAARPARIHHPTAWGWIEDSIALASVSKSNTPTDPSARARAANRGKSAGAWRSWT